MKVHLRIALARNIFYHAKVFSDSGASWMHRSMILAYDGETLRVESAREGGHFICNIHSLQPGAMAPAIAVDSAIAYAAYQKLKGLPDGDCYLDWDNGKSLLLVVGSGDWNFPSRPMLALAPDFQPTMGKDIALGGSVEIKNSGSFMTDLAKMAAIVKASDVERVVSIDLDRRELCATDGCRMAVRGLDLDGPVGQASGRFGVSPSTIPLMKEIAHYGTDLRLAYRAQSNRLIIFCGPAIGIFPATKIESHVEWTMLQGNDAGIDLPFDALERVLDFALSRNAGHIGFQAGHGGLWAFVGNVEMGRFHSLNAAKVMDGEFEQRGFFIETQPLWSVVDLLAGEVAVNISQRMGGPVCFKAGNKLQFVMAKPVSQMNGNPQTVDLQSNFICQQQKFAISRDGTRKVTVDAIGSGDLIERGTERFLVWWVSKDGNAIKLETVDGQWRRTGRFRKYTFTAWAKGDMFRVPYSEKAIEEKQE